MAWQATFNEPVPTPDGQHLYTLHDARDYILQLPERTTRQGHWKTAVEALLLVGNGDGPTDLARIGLMQALYSGTIRREAAGLTYKRR